MKHRVYLLMTVLCGILSFSQSEARIMDPSSGAQVGPPSWSVTIPVKNNPSIAQRMANKYADDFKQLNTKKPIDKSTSGSSNLPKKDTKQRIKRGKALPGKAGPASNYDREN